MESVLEFPARVLVEIMDGFFVLDGVSGKEHAVAAADRVARVFGPRVQHRFPVQVRHLSHLIQIVLAAHHRQTVRTDSHSLEKKMFKNTRSTPSI